MILEACIDNIKDGMEAYAAGASRIEHCSHLEHDGLTPDFVETEVLLKKVDIPVRIMIRERPGDFNYSKNEMDQMLEDIKLFKTLSIEGFVLGCLTVTFEIDIESTQRLVQAAHPLPVTFHKAFDLTADPIEAFKQIKSIQGIDTLLTSGGEKTALEGAYKIAELVKNKQHLTILVAGKVDQNNLALLQEITGSNAFHGRNIMKSGGS